MPRTPPEFHHTKGTQNCGPVKLFPALRSGEKLTDASSDHGARRRTNGTEAVDFATSCEGNQDLSKTEIDARDVSRQAKPHAGLCGLTGAGG
jgi:hypothetical protein